MKPVSPVIPGYEGLEIILAKDQPQYEPLPVLVLCDPEQSMVSRWRLDDEERAAIAAGKDLLLFQFTFGKPFQPVRLEVSETGGK